MVCPKCNYLMQPFDSECPRCHGKGLAPSTPATPPPTVAPQAVMPPVTAQRAPMQTAPPTPVVAPANVIPVTAQANASGATLPYFLVGHDGVFGKPTLYRVYGDDDALLFITAGGFHAGLFNQVKAMRDETGDGGFAASGAIVRTAMIASRTGGAVAGAGLGLAAGGLMWAMGKVADKEIAKRAQVLDAMTLDQLRLEAKNSKTGLHIAPANVSQVVLRPSKKFSMSDAPEVPGYLSFHHQPAQKTRKWKMMILSLTDAQLAVQEFRRVLGADNVDVKFPF